MGCTVNTSNGFSSKVIERDKYRQTNKYMPTTIQSGSELLTQKSPRMQSIKFSAPNDVQEVQSATISSKALLPRDIDFIGSVLHSHFLFKDIERETYSELVRSAKFFKLNPKEIIFVQGNRGKYLFIIMKGEVEILINDAQINVLTTKDIFGELALMHDTYRTATAKTLTKVELMGLEKEHFQQGLKSVAYKMYMDNKLCLEKCKLFSPLDNKTKSKLLESLAVQIFEDKAIVKEGEPGEYFYVIKSGKALLIIPNKSSKELTEGDYFGEQSLLNNCIRTATVTAQGKVELLCFSPCDLESILGKNYISLIYKNSITITLSEDKFLSKLMKSQLEKIASHMTIHKYKKSETVLKKGKKIDRVLVVVKGQIKQGESELIGKSVCIGSEILIGTFVNEFDYTAQTNAEIAEITKNKFEEVLGGSLANIIKENCLVLQLMNLGLFTSLSEEMLRKISKVLTVQKFGDGEVICRQYSGGSGLFIIQSGEVRFTIDGEYVRTLVQGSYFGERSYLKGCSRTATATAKGETSLIVITKEVLSNVIDESIQSQLESRLNLQDFSIELSDLSLIQFIGRGMFGSVFLSVHRETRALYAIKSICNSEIRRLKIQKNIKAAEEVLLKLDHPLIMRLVKTIKDESRVYFVQEFIDGKPFIDFLEEARPMNVHQVKFYVSNIILMLQHLHNKNIAHRDLKPENLILDCSGYLKLIDFDTAKKIKNRTYTIAGTPHYMAPEMIKGQGYNISVDCWSLGVVLYEMVYGNLPFGEYTDEPLEVYKHIIEDKVEYRNKFGQYRGIIEKLLEKNPGLRADYEKLMADEFFLGLKWEEIILKKIVPPYKPAPKSILVKEVVPEFCTQIIVEEEIIRYKANKL